MGSYTWIILLDEEYTMTVHDTIPPNVSLIMTYYDWYLSWQLKQRYSYHLYRRRLNEDESKLACMYINDQR